MAVPDYALVIPIELPPVVQSLRLRFDPWADFLRPHFTILAPFCPPLEQRQFDTIARAVETNPIPTLQFTDLVELENGNYRVLCLVPDPEAPLRGLIQALADSFPEYPPFEGAHGDDVRPHVTIAHVDRESARSIFPNVRRLVEPLLPLVKVEVHTLDWVGSPQPNGNTPIHHRFALHPLGVKR